MRLLHRGPRRLNRTSESRCGAIIPLAAILITVMIGFAALTVDVGFLTLSKTQLQTAADASALAAAQEMGSKDWSTSNNQAASATSVRESGTSLATTNLPGQGSVCTADDIRIGIWDSTLKVFTPTLVSPNAVEVTVHRNSAHGNAVPFYFAPAIGRESGTVKATAIAMMPLPPVSNATGRLIIDDEMIDTDEPAIISLASSLGKTPDALLTDANGDGFLDIPAGKTIELPTGQTGDEALFDTQAWGTKFPFGTTTQYKFVDFLCTGTALRPLVPTLDLTDVTWTSSNAPHNDFNGKKVFDPTRGIEPLDTNAEVLALVNSSVTHVAPVYKSDVSMIERTSTKYGAPIANLLGERRGLLAFKIMSGRTRSGSYLPYLTIQTVAPLTPAAVKNVVPSGTSSSSTTTASKPRIVK